MTGEELRARHEANLRTVYAVRQAERPDGLTASSVLGCSSYAARTLLGQPKGDSADFWRALRGIYTHTGLADDFASVDPGFVDGRKVGRFTWDPGQGLPVITGEFDYELDDVLCEAKTRTKAQCRWYKDHGPDPQESAQAAIAAEARGKPHAAIIYLPTDGGWEEAVVCMVDVPHWTREAREWLYRVDVRGEYQELVDSGVPAYRAFQQVIDPVPRDKPVSWCRLLCGYAKTCRGDYVMPDTLELLDPVMRTAAQEAEHWRQVRLDAEKREKAAKSRLVHAEGVVHDDGPGSLRVKQSKVPASAGRRESIRTLVERRDE